MATDSQGFGYADQYQSNQHPALNTPHQLGNLPSLPSTQQTKYIDNSQLGLVLRQAPIHARVALGKEKDRKPIDPPPVVQLIDKNNIARSEIYNSPYLFLTCTLVPETFDAQTKQPEVSSTYLTGSLVSSIHRLKDSLSSEGGFFVFGDLCVKQEGRYRLRFTLYSRDTYPANGSYSYVTELISNTFTVYAPRRFPGMTESTNLTRLFTDQGVKLRLRKEQRTLTSRKRSRPAADTMEALIDRDAKRPTLTSDSPVFQTYANLAPPLDQESSQPVPIGFPAPPFNSGNIPMSRHVSTTLPFATSGYYMTNFAPHSFH